jgi:hypothetical protein
MDFGMWVCDMGKKTESKVSACRVTAYTDVRGASSCFLDEMTQAFYRLSELCGVDCFGGEVVCEEEDGGVGKAVFDISKQLEVARSDGDYIAAAF